MKTQEFLNLLQEHPNKELIFEYQKGLRVGAHYHITEVKNVTVDSVDCGAGTDFWKETVIQLWESPLEAGKTRYMSAFKALSILNKVNRIKPMDPDAPLKFEYGNDRFHTAQLPVGNILIREGQLLVELHVDQTDCKAKETCGIPETANATEQADCIPGNGCC